MLSKQHRLKKKKDFQQVLRSGKLIKTQSFLIRYLPTDQPFNRLGFVVSKKVSLRANKRNKVKRWLREGFRAILEQMPKSFDLIIIALPSSLAMTYKKISHDALLAIKQIQ